MYTPTVGEHCYIRQRTGNYWVDSVKNPYTVISVEPNKIVLQAAECIFVGPRYYDSLPEHITENPYGKTMEFKPSRAKKYKDLWVHHNYSGDTYPYFVVFGDGYQYEPYLD